MGLCCVFGWNTDSSVNYMGIMSDPFINFTYTGFIQLREVGSVTTILF